MVKQISDNEIYLLIKYIKSVLWRVAKCLSYIEEAPCLKVKSVAYCGRRDVRLDMTSTLRVNYAKKSGAFGVESYPVSCARDSTPPAPCHC